MHLANGSETTPKERSDRGSFCVYAKHSFHSGARNGFHLCFLAVWLSFWLSVFLSVVYCLFAFFQCYGLRDLWGADFFEPGV